MENKTRSQNGIPILSRIPVIGGLFRDTKKSKDRTELIVLMRPEVALTKLDLYRMRQKIEDRTHFGPELEQDDCPDCPKTGDGKQIPSDKQILLPPDLPPEK
jgi:type II secretory pathway component GspD/PulD (secretin)